MSRDVKCRNCKFWSRVVSSDIGDSGKGRCRRYPPMIAKEGSDFNNITRFPVTLSESWCGEHQPAK